MKLNNHCAVALNNIKEGIITMDTDFTIIYINPATSTLLKKPKSKILGNDAMQFLSTHSRSRIKKIFHQIASDTQPFSQEITLPLNGKMINTTFIKLVEDGSYTGSIIIMQDITESTLKTTQLKSLLGELKKIHKKLSYESKLTILGKLTADLSHEINTPLTVILGYTSLLLKKLNPLDPLKKDLAIIHEEILRICNITRKVLNYTHAPKAANEKTITNKGLFPFPKRHYSNRLSSQIDRNKT
ncbi:MAG: PAS domain-containing protein [Deltaproteobacteria bacterium]|nr:PAS domain-containing protein [Deltaproteobacteria bacterium]